MTIRVDSFNDRMEERRLASLGKTVRARVIELSAVAKITEVATQRAVASTNFKVSKRDSENRTNEVSAYVNFTYALDTKWPIFLKTGFDTQNLRVNFFNKNPRRFYALPGTILSGALMPLTDDPRPPEP